MWTYTLLVDLSIVQNAIRTLALHDDQDPVRLNAEAFVTSLIEMGEVLTDGSLLRAYFFEVAHPSVGFSAESIDDVASMDQCKVRHVTLASAEEALVADLASLAEHKACDAVVILAAPSSRLLDAIDDAQLRGTLVHAVSLEPDLRRDPEAAQEFRHECDSGRIITLPEMSSWFEAPTVRPPAPVARSVAVRTEAPRVETTRPDVVRTIATRTSRRLPEYAEDLPGGAARFYGSSADFRVPEAVASFGVSSADVDASMGNVSSGAATGVSEPLSARDADLIGEVADHIVGLMYADERDEVRASGMQGIPAHVDRRLLGAAKRAFGTLLNVPLKKELRRQLWLRC